ncbi:proteasome subunit beta [Haloechinothrix sp. LS1_15]|uniref:proteasome subunit beta n=1 Tax=Haloechinothrix sp. LS1_15 TaxID=2652248 RepID=UPI002946BBCB|nr:proteasome subunit beta [Haloechinothrix sp. LS1_15]MDV6013990.1 proteasome subunit beta [Haloechinothrix sp. LS1_15]
MDNTSPAHVRGALPPAYLSMESSSFTDFLRNQAPELLPPQGRASGSGSDLATPHGTTIVALMFSGGVLIAGDRRATAGNIIAARDLEKVFVTDEYSAVGVAGTAGIALEMIRLYTVELEHYEKIEGISLSLDGKTNKLALMVRNNLDAALAGLAAIPLFVGYDTEARDPAKAGRIVSFDATGGRFEETAGYHAIGSGSLFAKSALKKLHDPGVSQDQAIRTAIESLYDAADDDTATGGPDVVRRIFPSVVTVTSEGASRLADERAAEIAEEVVAERTERDRRAG